MKNNKRFIERIFSFLIILIILIIFLFFFNLLSYSSVLEKKVIYSKVLVGDSLGFDVNGTALTFGMITPQGASSSRNINLSNFYGKEIKVEIFAVGDIAKFLSISENNFVLKKNETKTIKFVATSPKNTEYGTYDGNVFILVRKVWF